MDKIVTVILNVSFFVYIIATFIPIYHLVSEIIEIPFVDFIISLAIASIYIVNIIVAIIGAVQMWDITVWQGILYYVIIPLILLITLFCISKGD